MKILRQVKANKGVEKEYRKRLDKLIDAMNKSVLYWILADYGNRTPKEMAIAIQKRIKQWNKIFGSKAGDIALWFAKTLKKHAETGFKMSLGEQGINKTPTVNKDVFNAVKIENEDLIKSIPEKYFVNIQTIAMMTILYNWSETDLTNAIKKRYNITKRRAKIISSDQTHKTNALFKLAMCEDLGIKKAQWVYTFRSKEPRMSHIRADGKVFDLDKGLEIDGKYWLPAEDYNCKCDFKPVIPEIGD